MGSGITVTSVTTPALFGGPPETPSQIVRVRILRTRPVGPLHVTVHDVGGGGDGSGITTPYPRIVRADTADAYAGTDARADLAPDAGSTAGPDTGSTAGSTARPGVESTVEVAVRTPGAAPGTVLPAAVRVTTPTGGRSPSCPSASSSPSPAGPSAWPRTSTTTPCGGTPRPPTPPSGAPR